MYQALYRKYRPRTFSDVTGQDHVTITLQRQVMSGRMSHAYLFVGSRGTGKTTCAKVLARAVNCINPIDGDPCNECFACVGIENGSILDVVEMDAASNNGVDDVRALRDEAIYSPAAVNKRVYIIDEVHMLSNSAFNALLKILEEPPEHLVFVLATTALHKVPATILSRCQRFSFKRLSLKSIRERLLLVAKSEGVNLTDEAAAELSVLADGSMRDALSLLDQCSSDTIVDIGRVNDTIGLVGRQEVLNIVSATARRDTEESLKLLDKLYNDGRDMPSLLSEIAALVRDLLVYKLSPQSPLISGGFGEAALGKLAADCPSERLFAFLDLLREGMLSLSRGVGVKLAVELCLLRMCDERLSESVPALIARVERLEQELREIALGSIGAHLRSSSADKTGFNATSVDADGLDVNKTGTDTSSVVAAGFDAAGVNKTGDDATGIDAAGAESDSVDEINADSEGFAPQDSSISQALATDPWQSIINQTKSDMSIFSLLSDSSRVEAELTENTIIVRVSDSFTASLIESKKYTDLLEEAGLKILGFAPKIRVSVIGVDTAESKTTKIDDLEKFSIVRFE